MKWLREWLFFARTEKAFRTDVMNDMNRVIEELNKARQNNDAAQNMCHQLHAEVRGLRTKHENLQQHLDAAIKMIGFLQADAEEGTP